MGELKAGDHVFLAKEIMVDGKTAFEEYEEVTITKVEPSPIKPNLRYVVFSSRLNIKIRLSKRAIAITKDCPHCESLIPETAKFCPQCGWYYGHALITTALDLVSQERFDESVGYINKALEQIVNDGLLREQFSFDTLSRFDRNAPVWFMIDLCEKLLLEDSDYSNAISFYRNALVTKALDMSNQDRFDESMTYIDKALEYSSHSEDFTKILFSICRNTSWAIKESCEKMVTAYPDSYHATYAMGISFESLGRYKEALKWFDKCLMEIPDDSSVLESKGNTLFEMERYKNALTCFNKCLKEKPDDSGLLKSKGNTLLEMERYEKALKWFDRCLKEIPDDSSVLESKVKTLTRMQRYEEAMECFSSVQNFSPDMTSVFIEIGEGFENQWRYTAAASCFEKALEIDPEDYLAKGGLQRAQERARGSPDAQSIVKINRMGAIEFEEFVGKVFSWYGYDVETTSASGDEGVDLKLYKGSRLECVQVKHHSKPIGQPVIRDFYGSLVHFGAAKGYLVTNNTFTLQAEKFSRGKPIELVDGARLIKLIQEAD